jgi:hypothetical protein
MIFSLSCPASWGYVPSSARLLKPPGGEAGELGDRIGDNPGSDVPRLDYDRDMLAA